MENLVFFGCNYNDQKIKSTFDNLKKRIEADFPISCMVIDKRAQKTASDLWLDIKQGIDNSAFCVFDVTVFRPNVVLELGYALAIKNSDKIMISFKERKSKGKKPDWLLSDIGHLQRYPYNLMRDLEGAIRKQIEQMSYIKRISDFEKETIQSSDQKYFDFGKDILFQLRNDGSKSEDQLKDIIRGTNLRLTKMENYLKKHDLIKRDNNARFVIV